MGDFVAGCLGVFDRTEFEEGKVGEETRLCQAAIGGSPFWSGLGLRLHDRLGNGERRRENRHKRHAVISRSLDAIEHWRLDRVLRRGPGRQLVG
ncbi:hypothetical protein D9M72_510300 [compost metagenome]